jgi:hypothetical protein
MITNALAGTERIFQQYDADNDVSPVSVHDYNLAVAVRDLDNRIKTLAAELPQRVTGQPLVILLNGIETSCIYDPCTGIEYTLTHYQDRKMSKYDYTPVKLTATNAACTSETQYPDIKHRDGMAIDFFGQLIGHYYAAGKLTKAQYDLGHSIILLATEALRAYEGG